MKRLYFGGDVITMDRNVSGDAVLTDNGRILLVGKREQLLEKAHDAEQKDIRGGTLMPAFIDPHSHFSQVASASMQADLDGAGSASEIGARIAKYIDEHPLPQNTWINCRNYDVNLMPDRADPDLDELDSFACGHPLSIQGKSGHMGLFNSAAMKELGITEETPDPDGGKIGRRNGHLTGYLEENAFFEYQKKTPMPGMDEFLSAYKSAQKLYASYGITTLQEGMLVRQMLPLYRMLSASGIMKLDLVAYPDMDTFDEATGLFPEMLNGYQGHIRLGGLKIFLDGSPQGRTAWMRTPYKGEKEYSGYGTLSDEEVLAALKKTYDSHVQILAHCNGDAAAGQYIRCIGKAEEEYKGFREIRPVMIHAQLLGTDQIPQAAEEGIIASFFVAHVWHWGDIHVSNFGIKRASEISPVRTAIDNGMKYTFHQDSPVIMPDMLETVWCAVNRLTQSGRCLGSSEKVSVYDALKAVTINAAYQYGEENDKGSITPGKKADLIILDRDPLTVPSEEIRDIKVTETIKDGETVWN